MSSVSSRHIASMAMHSHQQIHSSVNTLKGKQRVRAGRAEPKRPIVTKSTKLAQHSDNSCDWGTPGVVRRFAQAFLAPSAFSSCIDLDYSSSAYWQDHWPDGSRPAAYLDGSKGRDVLMVLDRRAAVSVHGCGAGFNNPPGLNGGQMIQASWKLFQTDHQIGWLHSGFWVGFSIEHFASLQGVSGRNPLSRDVLIATIVPCRRIRYELHPDALIDLLLKKQKKREKKSKQWLIEQRQIKRLRERDDDTPVPGLAPTHASYITLLMNPKKTVRRQQLDAANKFLAEQADDSKSPFQRYEVIGSLEMR